MEKIVGKTFPVGSKLEKAEYVGCTFGSDWKFSSDCTFDLDCTFDSGCKFGSYCTFGSDCTFGSACEFGSACTFGYSCKFSSGCKFGSYCTFDSGCKFGSGCKFSSDCTFGSDCTYLGKPFTKLFQIQNLDGSGRSLNILIGETSYVEAGCFFGTVEEFTIKAVSEGKSSYAAIAAFVAAIKGKENLS